MKKYKFIGTEQEADGYGDPELKVAEVYDETFVIAYEEVGYWATSSIFTSEWQEVSEKKMTKSSDQPFPLGGHVVEAITELKKRTLPTPKQLSNVLNYLGEYNGYGEESLQRMLDVISIYLTKGTPTLDDLDNLKQ